jgi:vacuolar-type H+-ATPase subunit H
MAKQKKPAKHELESLIPTIKDEESHLEEMLGDTRARADGIVRDAEAQAAALIQSARKALPGILQAERDARRAALVRRADEAARTEEEKTREIGSRARAAMEQTVDYIVSLVWPGGQRPASPKPPPPREKRHG